MSESTTQTSAEESAVVNGVLVKPVKGISKIWFVPLVALCIGLWMVYYQWSSQGPLIVIEFADATGLEVGKTKIKTRSVDVGLVKEIELTDDLQGVLVTARMNANVGSLLHKDNQFWVVTPRISLKGVSGLNTLLSGPYINMAPGRAQDKSTHFTALASPPITPAGTPGLHITLNSNAEFAYKAGDPVIYKGLKVGEIEETFFKFDERVVYYNTFINAPYHKLITGNTRFWDASGVQLKVGAGGVVLDTGSIESLLTNGVTFGVPEGVSPGEPISDGSYFDIHKSYDEAIAQRYKQSAEFAVLVKDTVRGLQVGAPVEYRGLKIGRVEAINPPEITAELRASKSFDIPVIISIQPGRVNQPDNEEGVSALKDKLGDWVSGGLRASLKTGNLLTGALFVDLQHYPDEQPEVVGQLLDYDVIPSISDGLAQITTKVSAVLDNINQIKLQSIGDNTNALLVKMTQTAESLKQTSEAVEGLVASIQGDEINDQLLEAVANLSQLTKDFSAGSESYEQINQTLQTIQQTMKDMQPLLLQLNNKPNSLIFTNGNEGQRIEPKASGRTQSVAPKGAN